MGKPQNDPVADEREHRAQTQILGRVQQLVEDEHRLRARLSEGELSSDEENAALADVERELDQCWDLLRQRRAAQEAGEDPSRARVRPQTEVEGYLS
ncbi:DUF2630 family protein [Streptomyces sulphureus]|uniref:DUF2630 family protein n=1 Tax=Streptomyces sulphureus TaxID=47758 RepID=UPI00037E4E14|nr:DUF2630 family protein [Streptomyces sulphureus]